MHGDAAGTESLALRGRYRWLLRGLVLLCLVVLASAVGYVATHPEGLPTRDGVVTASTPTGEPIFVGVFAPGADFGRSLDISGVKVFATSTAEVTITPHLCRGGSVGVTSDPLVFCSEVVPTEGATLGAGDEIVLEVVGELPGTVTIDRIRVAYREDFQWATQRAGQPAVITILAAAS
jgi:hypothetical protein